MAVRKGRNDSLNYHEQGNRMEGVYGSGRGRPTRTGETDRSTVRRDVSVQSRRKPTTLISRIVRDIRCTLHAATPLVIHWFRRIYGCNSPGPLAPATGRPALRVPNEIDTNLHKTVSINELPPPPPRDEIFPGVIENRYPRSALFNYVKK